MSCCGGSGGVFRAPNVPGAVTGVAAPAGPTTIYRVTTPQGVSHDFTSYYEAQKVLAMRGGALDTINPGDD